MIEFVLRVELRLTDGEVLVEMLGRFVAKILSFVAETFRLLRR
jgi:hypothetical protein